VNLMGDIIQDGDKLAQLLGQTDELDPLEVERQRKDDKDAEGPAKWPESGWRDRLLGGHRGRHHY